MQHLVGGIFYPADKTAKKVKAQEVKWIPAYGYAHGEPVAIFKNLEQVQTFTRGIQANSALSALSPDCSINIAQRSPSMCSLSRDVSYFLV